MKEDNSVLIARNVPITFKTVAHAIYVSNDGKVTLVLNRPAKKIPCFSVDYLEHLCCKFYFDGKPRRTAIADMLLLNGLIHTYEYDDFYESLSHNVENCNITIISF